MALLDVNILVAAHRRDHADHERCLALVDGEVRRGFATCAHLRNGFLRLVTHVSVFRDPTPMAVALVTWQTWMERPASEWLPETPVTDALFADLCRQHQATGNAVYDLHLASLALAHDRALISSDIGFGRIAGLRWRTP
jgi:uncharacterized protein